MSVALSFSMERKSRAGYRLLTAEERQRLRLLISEIRRPASSRVGNRRALLPQEVAEAAYRSHLDGVSVGELAESLWRQYGYSSAKACANALYSFFRSAA